ncbi:hypothetical protein AN945_920 [Listeria monocytogenes]|nr:hypothetical protein M637_01085 [Listeria monocytogenes]ERH77716.1 hypothetical protein O174_05620 [Listeria monocytogenes serotype 4bV str. LS644]ERH83582.1 hypothetical protein O168_06415 [Listeria monocytogenes serotype 4bV str. LS643]KSZ41681.1 hypothetical protein AN945_920 [Listeria monocytogenes]KSZ45028.1 hypothetical protein AN919_701 [Listeria monocytogenes]
MFNARIISLVDLLANFILVDFFIFAGYMTLVLVELLPLVSFYMNLKMEVFL